jgi:hypothetical protein
MKNAVVWTVLWVAFERTHGLSLELKENGETSSSNVTNVLIDFFHEVSVIVTGCIEFSEVLNYS